MSTTSKDRAAAAAALFSSAPSTAPEPVEAIAEHARQARTARTKRIRRTVDLPPAHHHQLKAWCAEAAQDQGVADVTGQDVIAALVARLLTDETLARKIRADLIEGRD